MDYAVSNAPAAGDSAVRKFRTTTKFVDCPALRANVALVKAAESYVTADSPLQAVTLQMVLLFFCVNAGEAIKKFWKALYDTLERWSARLPEANAAAEEASERLRLHRERRGRQGQGNGEGGDGEGGDGEGGDAVDAALEAAVKSATDEAEWISRIHAKALDALDAALLGMKRRALAGVEARLAVNEAHILGEMGGGGGGGGGGVGGGGAAAVGGGSGGSSAKASSASGVRQGYDSSIHPIRGRFF